MLIVVCVVTVAAAAAESRWCHDCLILIPVVNLLYIVATTCHVPPPGKGYVVSRHLCCLCPLLGGSIVGDVSPPPNAKYDPSLSSSHPPSSLPKLRPPCPSSSNGHPTVPLCRICCCLPTPAYGWLLCFGHTALDIVDIVINIFVTS